MLPAGDEQLLRIVDDAFADAARRAGPWLACKPGCNQCCTGVFRISSLDAERLRHGLAELAHSDPTRHQRISERVQASVRRLSPDFPGDTLTGLLHQTDEAEAAFEDFADHEVCPVLDPRTGTCDLYPHRPMTCRTFGPPVATEDGGFGVCELCFAGAPDDAVRQGAIALPDPQFEDRLNAETGEDGETIVAFALFRQMAGV